MDTSIAVAIIGLLGAGAVGGLGFILTGLRAAVRDNSELIRDNGTHIGSLEIGLGRLDERFGGLERRFDGLEERAISEFGQIKDVLSRIEATQAEHSRQIEKLSGDQP